MKTRKIVTRESGTILEAGNLCVDKGESIFVGDLKNISKKRNC